MTATIKTVTAVDTGTDELFAAGHGLTTGDRFRLRNVGGALPAATPALAGATTYFAVRTNNDEIKIAPTSADALAGTNLFNLTGSGSGTTFIEYGLPYCERRVSAPLQQVFSIDGNEVWDALTALRALETGAAQTIWTGGHGARTRAIAPFGGSLTGSWTPDYSTGFVQSGGSVSACFGLLAQAGERITGVTIAAFGDGVVDATYTLRAVTPAGSVTTLCNAQADNNRAAAWGDVSLTLSPSTYTMGAGEMLHLQVSPNAGNYRVGVIRLTYDRP